MLRFVIQRIDQTEFTARVAEILIAEEVTPIDTLDTYVKATYLIYVNVLTWCKMVSGRYFLEKSDAGESDWKLEMTELSQAGQIPKARKLVCSLARPDEMEDVYKWLYDNIELFGDEENKKSIHH